MKQRTLSLLAANKECHDDLEKQWIKVSAIYIFKSIMCSPTSCQIKKGHQKQVDIYTERIKEARLKVKNDKSMREIDINTSNELLEAKNAMSPYTSIVCLNYNFR